MRHALDMQKEGKHMSKVTADAMRRMSEAANLRDSVDDEILRAASCGCDSVSIYVAVPSRMQLFERTSAQELDEMAQDLRERGFEVLFKMSQVLGRSDVNTWTQKAIRDDDTKDYVAQIYVKW